MAKPANDFQYSNCRLGLSTEEFARAVNVKPTSVRVRLSQTGSFHGIRPQKLATGRLLWPADAPARLLVGEKKGEAG